MSKRSLALRAFLGIYMALLLHHLWSEVHGLTPLAIGALALGIATAMYAHTRTGWALYSLLFAHMAVEWVGYGVSGWAFSWPESALELLHLAFDAFFLFVLTKAQWKQNYFLIFLATLGALGTISALAPAILHAPQGGHGLELGLAEFLILGGILGCTAYHAVRPVKIQTN